MISQPLLTFAEFRLDAERGELLRGTSPVALAPKAFALLQYLAARAGRLVSKQELLDAVWPDVFVGEAVLKGTIRDVRRALGDDPQEPRFIQTAHRRGYRFVATVESSKVEPKIDPARGPLVTTLAAVRPRVKYAHSGNVNIAYEVVGSGPIDLIFVMGWVSHLEYFWNEPSFAGFLNRLASMSRLILFDKRGTGLSDAVPVSQLPTLEQRLDDVRAVMEAAGSKRAVLLGVSEGGPMCSLFAATYPERTQALIMIGSYARRIRDTDYPWGTTREERDAFCQKIVDEWGGPVGIEERAPSKAADPAFREWWASYLRMGASPGAAVALTRMNAEIDIRGVLPSIQVPTLVLHRAGDRCLRIEEGQYLASRIRGATFVKLDGEDHLPFVGDQDAILNEVERFVAGTPAPSLAGLVLASIVTIRSGAEAEDLVHLRRVFDREVAWGRGSQIATGSTDFVAAFDGPGRAVRCAASVVEVARRSRIAVRGGVHIGECDLSTAAGPILDLSARLADAACVGEVCVSRTIVDLVHGSGLEFGDAGTLRFEGLSHDLPVLKVV
jgi:pimeloyl-ACP methyl ester carboxylesterase/DNA-binding winged helix-turn-helix (wHTH) protein